VVKIVEQLVERHQPEVVYTQHAGDLNVDHAVTYRATLTATRPLKGAPVKAVYAYEVASSTEWAFQKFAPPFRPNIFMDIGDTLERKIQAMQLQTYTADTMTIPCDKPSFRIEGGTLWDGKNLHQLYQEAYTPWEWQPRLKSLADELNIPLFSTPFDVTAVDFLERMQVPAH